jgi:hypothetical protein
MLIFDVSDRATPDRILAGDPYSPGGVVSDRRIRPWIVPLGSLLLTTGRIDDTVIQDVQVTYTREDEGRDGPRRHHPPIRRRRDHRIARLRRSSSDLGVTDSGSFR